MENTPPLDAFFYSEQECTPELYIGGKEYFNALAKAFKGAEKSVLICGWSFNLSTVMNDDGETLEEVLFSIPETVKVRILIWDYNIFYVADRDPFTSLQFSLKHKSNIEFRQFDFHPIMSSMHVKMVMVDAKELFLGGIDLDLGRRDGERNLAKDDTRREGDGRAYPPFRDYALKFRGGCADRFEDVFYDFWKLEDIGTSRVNNDFSKETDAQVYFSRTIPKFKGNRENFSTFKLHKWLIRNSSEYIYIENQYLTSTAIGDLLIERLREPNGPEVVIVVAYGKMPVIERLSMGALLTDSARRLLANDPHRRLRIYTMLTSSGGDFVKVHSKCLIVDGKYLKVGSSNINNRSMEFDYEMDAMVAGSAVNNFSSRIFSSLLAPEGHVEVKGSLIEAFDLASKKWGRVVEIKNFLKKGSALAAYKDYLPLDKKEMTFFERIGQALIQKKERYKISLKVALGILFLLLNIAGAISVETDWVQGHLDGFVELFGVESGLALAVLFFAGYVAFGSFFFPLNAYIFLCGAYFNMATAFSLAMFGAIASACISYAFGTWFKGGRILEGQLEKAQKLRKVLRRNSFKALVFLRLVPVAPFPVVNFLCGKFQMGFGRYVAGTILGIAPGAFMLIFFEKRLIDFIKGPSLLDFVVLALLALAGVGLGVFFKKRIAA